MWAAKVKINAHWLQRQPKLFSPADCLLGGFVSKKLEWLDEIDLQGLQLLNYQVGFIFHNPVSFRNPGNFVSNFFPKAADGNFDFLKKSLDSIAVSLLGWSKQIQNQSSPNRVSEGKIQLTILILRWGPCLERPVAIVMLFARFD